MPAGGAGAGRLGAFSDVWPGTEGVTLLAFDMVPSWSRKEAVLWGRAKDMLSEETRSEVARNHAYPDDNLFLRDRKRTQAVLDNPSGA